MPEDREPLQTEEVVQMLNLAGECALVHDESKTELYVFTDRFHPREPWLIKFSSDQLPEAAILRQALALGFQLRGHQDARGSHHDLYRNCMGVRAAATKALDLMRLLPGVSGDAWLWVTIYEPDQRGEMPEKPKPWPPSA